MSAVESWFAPAVVAEPLPKRRAPQRAAAPARPKAQRRPQRSSFRVRLPLVWMAVFALLLVGVVAVNVAVLRANVSVNDLDKTITRLQQDDADLALQYSRAIAPPRLVTAAGHAGLVRATSPTLLNMGSGK